jgi:hypothetical protein
MIMKLIGMKLQSASDEPDGYTVYEGGVFLTIYDNPPIT